MSKEEQPITNSEQFQEQPNNKGKIMIAILVAALIYVPVMTAILENFAPQLIANNNQSIKSTNNSQSDTSSQNTSNTIQISNSGEPELDTTILTKDEALSECSEILASTKELEILDEITKINNIQTQINLNETPSVYFRDDELTQIQELYKAYSETLTIGQVYVLEGYLNIVAQDDESNISYKVQYLNNDVFSKVINTLYDPDAPYYLNDNNQEFSKILFV